MKILKIIGFVLLSIVVLLLLIALFIPKNMTVSVTETVKRPKQVVYDYVRILDNQKEYSIWVMQDPNLKPEISGTDGTVGAIQRWDSKIEDVGKGEQEIVSLTPDRIDVDLRFEKPFKGEAKAATLFKAISENETEVTSEFYSNSPYPFNLMFYVFGRSMMKDAEMKNLQNIKRNLEKQN